MFRRVLLCFDGSEGGRSALRRGAELAILLKSQVFVLSIVPSTQLDPMLLAVAVGSTCVSYPAPPDHQKLLDESVQWLISRGVNAEGFLASGDSVDQISKCAKRLAIDLIVLSYYPKPTGGAWWSSSLRTSLAERVGCCIFVANGDIDNWSQ